MKKRMILVLLGLVSLLISVSAVDAAVQADCTGADTLIAFEGKDATGRSDIFTIAADGSNLQQLTETDENSDEKPAWSPSGEDIAFTHQFALNIMSADGSNVRALMENPSGIESPTWSPDGSQIAFLYSVGDPELDVMNVDGSDRRVLVKGTGSSPLTEPEWSPTGNQILYRVAGSGAGLYVIDLSQPDAEPVLLSKIGTDAQWTPDGTEIAYLVPTGGSGISIMNADGTSPKNLGEYLPAFSLSPDGAQAAYIGYDNNGMPDLYVIDLESGEKTQLTSTPDITEANPDWQPCGGTTVATEPIATASTSTAQPTEAAEAPAATDSLTITDTQLVDVPVTEGLIITLSDDWLVWRFEDYPDADAAFAAFKEDQASVGITPATDPTSINGLQFLAWYRSPDESTNASVTALVLPLSDLKTQLGANFTTQDMITSIGYSPLFSLELSGRQVAVGNNPQRPTQGIATFIFPEQNLGAVVFQSAPAEFRAANLELLTMMLTSLRPAGEPLALEEFNAFTGKELSSGILPPASADTGSVDTTGEATTVPAQGQTCQISAAQNVNLRSGPGTSFARAGSLAGGTQIGADGQATGTDGMVWWRLSDGTWVRSDVVDEVGVCDMLPEVTP